MTASGIGSRLLHGLLAGGAGTAALNVATYADMTLRARPASPIPERDVEVLAERASISLGEGEQADNRRSAAGALMGYLTGLTAGVAWAAVEPALGRLPTPVAAGVLGAGVMAATDASSAALGTTDPRRWSPGDWLSDLVPHALFGIVTVAAYGALRE